MLDFTSKTFNLLDVLLAEVHHLHTFPQLTESSGAVEWKADHKEESLHDS